MRTHIRRSLPLLLPVLALAGCETVKPILDDSYYGNTISQWLTALLVAVGAVVLGKTLYWVIGRYVKKLTAKTETRLDDLIVDMVEEPLVFAASVAGVYYALNLLVLSVGVRVWLGRLVYLLIIISIAWMLTRLFDALVEEYLVPIVAESDGDLDDQLLPIVRRGVRGSIWIVAIVVGLNNAGYDVGALIAGLGIGGLAFALAAQDTVANLFGGFTIFTDRPFTINDRIKIAGFDGKVSEIGVRSTRIRTLEGRVVTIPNSKIANAPTENVTSEPGRKVVTNLGLTYDMNEGDVQKAMDLLREIAAADDDIEADPLVAFNAFGDFALNVMFIYWIKKDAPILDVQTRTNMSILKRFNQAKLDFAFPTQTLFTKNLG